LARAARGYSRAPNQQVRKGVGYSGAAILSKFIARNEFRAREWIL
jgi:hypothetical protein